MTSLNDLERIEEIKRIAAIVQGGDSHYARDVPWLLARIDTLEAEVKRLQADKDTAYSERDQMVALLASMFPSSLGRHGGEDWEDDWRNIIYIDLPTGQASWHIHDSELSLFAHVTKRGGVWDGHTTDEKYRRVRDLVAARAGEREGEGRGG